MYDTDQKLRAKIVADSDRCVMCGLMVYHIGPTFDIERNEADSPRGRIVLAKAIAKKQLKADESARTHLESCFALLCIVSKSARQKYPTEN